MSEYWKSTPKYFCKYCQQFVKDTKFDKQQHDASPKHQGNVQRHLRNLQRTSDREERDKQRARDEVARLNGLVSNSKQPPASQSTASQRPPPTEHRPQPQSRPKQRTADEQKKHIEQLAELGVAIPQEYRSDVAITGDWETVEVVQPAAIKTEGDVKSEPHMSTAGAPAKRKHDEAESDDEDRTQTRQSWGSKTKSYKSANSAPVDFAALLAEAPAAAVETETRAERSQDGIKQEHVDEQPGISLDSAVDAPPVPIFKKRKPKASRS